MTDERELEWWRTVFACRFQADNLPKPGTALFGTRLVLMVQAPDGALVRYDTAHREKKVY